ncbi:MAG: phosphoserine phosphatase SerB, partial [Hyphomicrobiales bacterium]
MDKTLFLIAAPDGAGLGTDLTTRLQSLLPGAGAPDWLAEGEACTLALTGDESIDASLESVREIVAGAAIDIVCLPGRPQRRRLLISDMDSTVIDQECIDEVAAQAGIGAAISAITRKVIAGELGFEEGFARRVALMGGISAELLEQVYQTRITFKSGAATLVATMRANGAHCALV